MEEALAVTEAQAVQFLRSRRSVRIFLDRPVEREKVQRLMEIARYAPTGGNSQQVHWTVFTDKARIDEMARLSVEWLRTSMAAAPPGALPPYIPRVVSAWDAGFDAVLRGAPVLIVASAPATAPNGLVDLTLALSYLDLAAPTLGLGTCWAGILRGALHASAPLKAMVGLPEGHTHQYPMMLGYPKFKYHRLPERRPPAVTWK
jgi:nitroreductase